MLRDQQTSVARSHASQVRQRIVGWLSIAALCGAGLAVVGVRAPATARAQDQVAEAPDGADVASTVGGKMEYDFSYVPEDTMALFAVRPAELAADPRLRPLAELLEQNTRPGLPSKLVEQSILALVASNLDEQGRPRVGFSPEQVVIHTKEPVDFIAYLKKSYPSLTEVPDGGYGILVTDGNPGAMSFFTTPDKQTLLGRVRSDLVKLLTNRNAALPPRSSEKWQSDAKGPILVVVQSGPIGTVFTGRADTVTSLLGPLLKGSDTLVLSVEPHEELKIVGRLACKSPDDAKRVTETLNALAVIAQNAADTQRERIPQNSPDAAAAAAAFKLIDKCLASRKITTNGNDVLIETTIGKTDDAVKLVVETLAPAVKAARAAAQRTTSMNNLKQIGLAMHNYAVVNKHFPPAVLYGPDGKTPHSWRVALLAYMEQDALALTLYRQYRLDQPWDSAENRKVLEQMPSVYRHPMDEPSSLSTSYFVLTGRETVFPDGQGKGTSIAEIQDGTSRTLLAVEAKRDIPWTKPEDIAYTVDGPLPKLGGLSVNGFNAGLADGSVQFFADKVDEKMLRAMISKAGRETIGE